MNKKFRKLILPLSIFATLQAQSMGLGTLQVQSILDEELKGSIPLVLDGTEDLETLEVSLASEEDYKKVGLDKSYVPSNIRIKLVGEDQTKTIEITSKGPISEPIVSLLIVVDWSNGHLLREYTLLLDPPIFNSSQIQKNYSNPVQTQTYKAPKKIESTQQPEPQTKFTNSTNTSNSSFSNSTQVIVEAGDTLWKIATRFNSGYSSPQQMMVAIFNNNPTAFQNNDMNFLRKGAVLDIPNSDDVSLISKDEAIAEVKTQINNWSRLNSQDDASTSNNSGSSVDYGIELVPPSDSDSSDSNSTSGSGTQRTASALAELRRAREELASSTLENEELSSRVLELEQIVQDQEMAISLKDDDLALLQKQLTESNSTSDKMTDDVWDASNDSDKMASDDSSEDTMTSDSRAQDSMSEDTMSSDSMTEDTMTSDSSMTEDNISEDSNAVQIEDVDQLNSNTGVATEVETTTPPVKEEKSFIDKILDYKLYILGLLGTLLLAVVGFVLYKRRSDNIELDSGSFYENETEEDDGSLNNFNSPQTELNLSNLDDDLIDNIDGNFREGSLEEELDLSLDTEPEVVVMDENTDDDIDKKSADEVDLEFDEIDLETDDLDNLSELDDNNNDTSDEDDTELADLEFNVDDLNLDDETTSEIDSTEPETIEEDEFEDLSLDFDLDELNSEEDDTSNTTDDSNDTLLGDDFDLDIDSDETELEDVVEEGEELEDLVFDTGERTVVPESSEEKIVEDLEFDLDDDMFSTDDLDLDGDDTTEVSLDPINVATIPTDDDESEFDLGLDFDEIVEDDAIDTKLDLAKAYFEMGDIDGAKQMVTEIIVEGNDDQKSKAEKLKEEIENA